MSELRPNVSEVPVSGTRRTLPHVERANSDPIASTTRRVRSPPSHISALFIAALALPQTRPPLALTESKPQHSDAAPVACCRRGGLARPPRRRSIARSGTDFQRNSHSDHSVWRYHGRCVGAALAVENSSARFFSGPLARMCPPLRTINHSSSSPPQERTTSARPSWAFHTQRHLLQSFAMCVWMLACCRLVRCVAAL